MSNAIDYEQLLENAIKSGEDYYDHMPKNMALELVKTKLSIMSHDMACCLVMDVISENSSIAQHIKNQNWGEFGNQLNECLMHLPGMLAIIQDDLDDKKKYLSLPESPVLRRQEVHISNVDM